MVFARIVSIGPERPQEHGRSAKAAERSRFAPLGGLVDQLHAGDGIRKNAGKAFRLALQGAELGDAYQALASDEPLSVLSTHDSPRTSIA